MVLQFHKHHADTLIQTDLTHISAPRIKDDGRALGLERCVRDWGVGGGVGGDMNKSGVMSKFGNLIAYTSKYSSQNPT